MNRFMIGPIGQGLRKDLKPFAIPEDSFEVLRNAYQFRGRIVRKTGYELLGRLTLDGITFPELPVMGLKTRELPGINIQNLIGFDTRNAYTYSGGSFTALPSVMPVVWNGTDYNFFWTTNYAQSFWATNNVPGIHGWSVTLFANAAGTGTSATVDVTSAGNTAAVGDFIYFLNLSGAAAANNLVTAIVTAINVGGNPNVITVQAVSVPATFTWTNGIVTGFMLDSTQSISGQDGIRYYANVSVNLPGGVTPVGLSWVNYNPPIDATTALAGCLMIFAYRGYLVFLNTYEGTPGNISNYPNRARWTQIGTPYYANPVPNTPNLQTFDPLAVRDDIFGRGGANDAPTNEAIVSAGFVRDILVVYFERSTWRLRFVNNSQNPFVWERVNVELGSDSTFSQIVFDKGLMTIGDRGIVISDANDTARFDEKIPDDIFKIRQANNGLERVYGIRTFQTRLLYWTYPSSTNPSGIYPDSVLVYNYETKNWSYFDDSFTCFGYFYPEQDSETWGSMTDPWATYNYSYDYGINTFGYETIIAGNQQGFVFKLETDATVNAPSLSIANIVNGTVTSANHNLKDGDWITITGVTGTTFSDGVSLNGRNFKVANPQVNQNTFNLTEFKPIAAGNAIGSSFTYTVGFVPIIPGSVQIDVGLLSFKDPDLNGILYESGVASGTINYETGSLTLNFNPAIGSTPVNIRVVSYSPQQLIEPVSTTGAYTGGGLIAKISNFDIQTKVFNFFGMDRRSRLHFIDFYVDTTENGEFTCNVLADSGETIINEPLSDNLQSNVVQTKQNPYQFGTGCEQTIYRLFAECIAQTLQLQLTMSDRQMAVNVINSSSFEMLAMIFNMRQGGRLI